MTVEVQLVLDDRIAEFEDGTEYFALSKTSCDSGPVPVVDIQFNTQTQIHNLQTYNSYGRRESTTKKKFSIP